MVVQLSIGARVRKSPFFQASCRAGLAAASVYNHMYMPTSYGDPVAEYNRLISDVAMWDVAVERQVALKGPDALALARLLTPRNLDGLVIGQGKYVPICNHSGAIINDPVLLQVAEDEIWLSIADSDIQLWASAVAGTLKLDVDVYEPDVSPLAIQGPKAVDVVSDLFGDWVRELKHFGFRVTELDGIPLVVARSGWSKQGGYELYLRDFNRGDDLWARVAEVGKPYNIGPGAPNYIERIESGLISYGTDTDSRTNPFELGMDKFIALEQPHDFIGKDALIAMKKAGINRRFMGFIIDGPTLASANEDRLLVSFDGEDAGYVSACVYSLRVGENIGVGMVSTTPIEKGEMVTIHMADGPRSAKIVPLPFL
jgi:glycine cleavage system aminomethyltransferase T